MARPSVALVWFRRDLRVHDHPALDHALKGFDLVLPLFVVDPHLLAGRWRSPNRRWFLAGALTSLRAELRARDSQLAVIRGDPATVVPAVAAAVGARVVVASRDYSPFGRRRDEEVARALAADGVAWAPGRGLLVHEPQDVAHEKGGAFSVFSPFHRRWQELPLRAVLEAPRRVPTIMPSPAALPPGHGDGFDAEPAAVIGDTTPTANPELLLEPSEAAARGRLARWIGSPALRDYTTARDRLDLDGTSRLSQDLRWGLLSPVEVVVRSSGEGEGRARYRSELAWRDFYAHLLWYEPRLARQSFRRELDAVAWSSDARAIEAWKLGRTGYPVVDAAMRQLLATGWMHNRARMIAASFLTKHLGVDWRVGEAHFMEHLVDGDPASNNGGWQWSASTGTDPQPYFRIFNPLLQGGRHDPQGRFVRRWVPELRSLDGDVHEPHAGVSGYPAPIVDHAGVRARVLDAYAARPGRAGSDVRD